MAEAGRFAERVKQQADIVRVIGEYVRLKKTGQNFTGLCPFHQEKTPSFSRASGEANVLTASVATWAATFSNS